MPKIRFTTEQKDAAVASYYKSGLSIKKYCEANGLSYWSFRDWLAGRSSKKSSARPIDLPVISFSPVAVPVKNDALYVIEFSDGTVLRIHSDVSCASVIAALRGRK